jgi:hypothetical protein
VHFYIYKKEEKKDGQGELSKRTDMEDIIKRKTLKNESVGLSFGTAFLFLIRFHSLKSL